MTISETASIKEKVLEENRRVHALEDRLYLDRHPEQTNFYQARILRSAVDGVCSLMDSEDARVLELGCGTGYLYLEFLRRGCRMTGVDLSAEMIRVLENRIPQETRERSRLVVSDVEAFLQTDDETYDAIVLSALLHHLYDYESVIRSYCERLRSGGTLLIFFEPLKQEIASAFRYSLHKTVAGIDEDLYRCEMQLRGIPLLEEEYHLSDYQRQFGGIDPEKLADILSAAGMNVLNIEKYCARRYGLSSLLATHLIGTQNTFNLVARK
ncbi:MAG: class I SAM-dependent methyltransferase [Nitrospinae bacterium]|nr:class I SAM-dependent methyltransferase [Nitrospinota bacterium]